MQTSVNTMKGSNNRKKLKKINEVMKVWLLRHFWTKLEILITGWKANCLNSKKECRLMVDHRTYLMQRSPEG